MTRGEFRLTPAVLGFVLSFAICSCRPSHGKMAPESAGKPLQPCVTITGANSLVTESGCHRILSNDDWVRLWQKHKGKETPAPYDHHYNPLELPEVDFDRYMVIAIFQGRGQNSAGLTAVSITEENDHLVFRFDDKSYQSTTGNKVTAYGFFVLPRTTKAVVIEENVQNYLGKPPAWKERITFPGF